MSHNIRRYVIVSLYLGLFILASGCANNVLVAPERGVTVADETVEPTAEAKFDPEKLWQNGRGQAHKAILDDGGSYLAVGTSNGLYLYDTVDGRQIEELSVGEPVFSLAFSPDSRLLAYVPLNSNQVEVWDLAGQQPLSTLPAEQAPIRHLAISPASDTIAAGTFDAMQLWRLDDGELISRITPEEGARIRDLSFSADGAVVAASLIREGGDQAAYWLTEDGRLSGTFVPAEDLWLANSQISADSLWLAVEYGASEGSTSAPVGLLMHYLGPPTPFRRIQRDSGLVPGAWFFSEDGLWLVTGHRDGQIAIWSTTSDEPPTLLPNPGDAQLVTLEMAAGRGTVTAVYDDGTIREYTLPGGSVSQESEIAYSQPVEAIGSSRQGDAMLVLEDSGNLQLWDVHTGALQRTLDQHTDGPVNSLVFSPDGRALAVGTGNGQVRFIATETGEELGALPDHLGAVDGLAFSPDGRSIASGLGERVSALAFDDTVRIWSWPDGNLQLENSGGQEEVAGCSAFQNQVAFTPDGKLLVTASHDFTVQLWRADDGGQQNVLTGHEAPVLDLAISPDGTAVASASEDGTIRIWPIESDQPAHILASPAFGWQAVAYAPDSRTLAGATTAGDILLWDVQSGKQSYQLSAGVNPRSDLAFSADGSLIAGAVGPDMNLWYADSGELATILPGVDGLINSFAFSTDGRWLATGSQNGTVILWRMNS